MPEEVPVIADSNGEDLLGYIDAAKPDIGCYAPMMLWNLTDDIGTYDRIDYHIPARCVGR